MQGGRFFIFIIFLFAFFFFISMKIESHVFIRIEGKVDQRDESYAWIPKILEFRQTPQDRKFSYLCYFYPKCHVMVWDWLRGHERS